MTGRPRLCIDIDNVLGETDRVMRRVIRDYTAGRVDLRYADIRHFDYWRCTDSRGASITKEEWKDVHQLFSEPKYLWLVEPVEGVQDCFCELTGKYDLHLATSRLAEARRTTVEWLEAHAFPSHSLHFLRHGEKHLSLGGFAAGIEDDRSQAEAFASSGTPCYLLAHPWNVMEQEFPTIRRVDNWNDLTGELLALESPE